MSYQEQNVYEAESHYANEKVTTNFGAAPAPPTNVTEKHTFKNVWRVITAVFGMTTIVLLAATITLLLQQSNNQQTDPENFVGSEPDLKSCAELRQKGKITSGIYRIQPVQNEPAIEAYCDMETDGGGWSLVASIHESDIRRKCYTDDVWSSYVPDNQKEFAGKNNWENDMIFGNVHRCSNADYKNSAYYAINASNLMIWQVPSGGTIETIKSKASLRYRTTSNFLQTHGGSLKNLFAKHFPLTVKEEQKHRQIIEALVKRADDIKSKISDWYEYTPGEYYRIIDSSMYSSYGNKPTFQTSKRGDTIYNGKQYRYHDSFTTVNSVRTAPFTLIAVVRNDDRSSQYFSIQIYSSRSSQGDKIASFENTTTLGNFKLQYRAVQFFDKNLHTPCRLYFVISNVKDWGSIEPSRFYCDFCHYSGSSRYTRYQISDRPARLIYGYMLLARKVGHNVTSEQLNSVAEIILETIAKAPNVFRARSTNDTLVVPITFDKGSVNSVLTSIPPHFRANVQPGFLQFRAYNYTGYPNAICPAVKVDTISPEYVCIGGISGDASLHGTCGDFAGWGGKAADSLMTNHASGSAHSRYDTLSSFLIFYR